MKEQKGITLIALVITIIVLLILAGVTIAMLTGNNSAPQKASEASIKDAIGAGKDAVTLTATQALADYYDKSYVPNSTAQIPDGVTNAQTAVTKATYTSPDTSRVTIKVTGNNIEVKSVKDATYYSTGAVNTNGGITWTDHFGS